MRPAADFTSARLEPVGARRCVQSLKQRKVPIKEFVSDQHPAVQKVVGKSMA